MSEEKNCLNYEFCQHDSELHFMPSGNGPFCDWCYDSRMNEYLRTGKMPEDKIKK